MSIGLGQILVVALIFVVLFGNIPKLLKDLATGIKQFKNVLKDHESAQDNKPKESSKSIDQTKKHSE